MEDMRISNDVHYIGVNDPDIDIFEGQYPVKNGVSYNSYVIMDDKIAVLDTADQRVSDKWMKNLLAVLGDREPDYLVVHHMEPDHAANIAAFAERFPEAKLVGNAKTFPMLKAFFPEVSEESFLTVAEGDTLELGKHTLTFVMAPMVHWPEVMMSYEAAEGILFAADGFGTFGTTDTKQKWSIEARRYYYNIVGKYGAQVQAVLKKAAGLDIKMICPLHGPVLKSDLDYYLRKYDMWSQWQADKEGVVILYASVYGHTKAAAVKLAELVRQQGEKRVVLIDLTRTDVSVAVSDAFRYDHMILASVTTDGQIFPAMEKFIDKLLSKGYRNRSIGFVENGSWGPTAARLMKQKFENTPGINLMEPVVTIKSALNEDSKAALMELAKTATAR